jgi:hypothetical protein
MQENYSIFSRRNSNVYKYNHLKIEWGSFAMKKLLLASILLIFISLLIPLSFANACFNAKTLDCYDSSQLPGLDSGSCTSAHTYYAGNFCPQTIRSNAITYSWSQVVPQLQQNGCCVARHLLFNSSNIVANQEVCDFTKAATGFPNQTWFFGGITSQTECNIIAQNPTAFVATSPSQACANQGGRWCNASLVTSAVHIPNIGLDPNRVGQVCVSLSACPESVLSCDQITGSTGTFQFTATQICADGKQLNATTCCVAPTEATCANRNGDWCTSCAAPTYDITGTIGNLLGQTSSSSVCCAKLPGGQSSCVVPTDSNQGITGNETICNDGADNNNNGLIDILDPHCRLSISGVVTPTTISSRGISVVARDVKTGATYTTTTLLNGNFVFSNLPLSGVFNISVLSYTSNNILVNTTANNPTTGLVLTISGGQLATFTGEVKSAGTSNLLIGGALVYLENTNYFAYTDPQGKFTITGIEPKSTSYTYVVLARNYIENKSAITINSNTTFNRNITLRPTFCPIGNTATQISQLKHVVGSTDVDVEFAVNSCFGTITQLNIYRCEVTAQQNCNNIASTAYSQVGVVSGSTLGLFLSGGFSFGTYRDESPELNWRKTYRYYVESVYQNEESLKSSPQTITLGNAICEGKNAVDQFCSQGNFYPTQPTRLFTGPVICNAQNEVSIAGDVCTIGKTCVETRNQNTNTVASCVQSDICSVSQPNSFLSLFFPNSQASTCINPVNTGGAQCYYDVKTSNVNTCLLCKPEMTCADYKTADACGSDQNTCRAASSQSGCEWVPTGADSLNTGVCKDKSVSLCDECNSGSIFSSNSCDSVSCKAFSTLGASNGACFYSETQLFCKSEKEITCYDFTYDSCGVLTPPNGFCVRPPLGVGGLSTNSVTCMRDTNVDTLDDCTQNLLNTTIISVAQCRKDNSPPQTFVVLPSITETMSSVDSIVFIAIDPNSPVTGFDPIKATYYCVEGPNTQNTCRDRSANFVKVDPTTKQVSISQLKAQFQDYTPGIGMQNNIFYYSVDHANNHEAIKSTSINVDQTLPQISAFSYRQVYDVNTGRSEIIADFNTLKPATCSATIGPASESSLQSSVHKFIFKSVPTGAYSVPITCTDATGNQFTATYTVVVNGNGDFTDMRPNGVVGLSTVTIEFKTNFNRACRFNSIESEINPSFAVNFGTELSRSQTGDGRTLHTATVSVAEGRNYYRVVCQPNPNNQLEAHPNLVITFNGDLTSPTLETLTTAGTAYNFNEVGANSTIVFLCQDEPENGFGCGKIEYCGLPLVDSQFNTGTCTPSIQMPNAVQNANGGLQATMQFEKSQTVCYRAVEKNNPGYGGARTTQTICQYVTSTFYPPHLRLSQIPRSTTTTQITFNASIYTVLEKVNSTLVLNATTATPNNLFRYSDDTHKNVYLNSKITYVRQPQQNTEYHLVLRKTQAGELVAGFNTQENRTYIALVQGTNKQILVEKPGHPSGLANLEFVAKDNKLEFIFGMSSQDRLQTTTTWLQSGTYGVNAKKLTSSSDIPTTTQYLAGYPKLTQSKFFIDKSSLTVSDTGLAVGVNQVIYPTTDINTQSKPNEFTQQLIFHTGEVTHGTGYQLGFWTTDLFATEQKSDKILHNIFIDLEGPTVEAITFRPVTQIPGQTIPYAGQLVEVQLLVRDDFSDISPSNIQIKIDNEVKTLYDVTITGNSNSGYTIKGKMDTVGLLVGDKQNVEVTLTDVIGNSKTTLREEALSLALPTEFGNLPTNLPTIYTNNANVNITLQMASHISCVARYTDHTQTPVEDQLTNSVGNNKVVSLSKELPNIDGQEVLSRVIIYCTTTVASQPLTVGILQNVVYDRKNPLIEVLDIGNYLRIDDKSNPAEKSYRGTYSQPSVITYADEPVICKFTNDLSKTYSEWDSSYNSAYTSKLYNDVQRSGSAIRSTATDPDVFDVFVTCEDRAGNLAIVQKVTYDISSSHELVIDPVSPKTFTNSAPVLFEVKTYQGSITTCSLNIGAATYLMTNAVSTSTLNPISQRTHRYAANLAENTHAYTITCQNGAKQANYTSGVTVDRTAPKLTILQKPASEDNTDLFGTIIGKSNETGIAKVYANGELVFQKAISANEEFTVEVPYHLGANQIKVFVYDNAQNFEHADMLVTANAPSFDLYVLGLSNSVLGTVPKVPIQIKGAGQYTFPSVTLEAVIKNVEGSTVFTYSSSDIVYESQNTSYLRAKTREQLNLDDGVYTLEVLAKLANSPVALDIASFTLDSTAPVNVFISPSLFIKSFNEPIQTNTTYTRVLDKQKDSITVRDLSTNIIRSITPTRTLNMLRGLTTFTNGRIVEILVTSGYHQEEQSVTSQVSIYDVEGPLATVSVRGVSGNFVRTPRPVFEIVFNEPAKVNSVQLLQGTQVVRTINSAASTIFVEDVAVALTDSLTADGSYRLQISAVDKYNNHRVTNFDFTYAFGEIQARLDNPKFGVNNASVGVVSISTDRPATCYYGYSENFTITQAIGSNQIFSNTTTSKFTHQKTNFAFTTTPTNIFVKCTSDDGGDNEQPALATPLYYVTSGPAITVSIAELPSQSMSILSSYPPNGQLTLNVSTSQPAICRYSVDTQLPYAAMTPFRQDESALHRTHSAAISANVAKEYTIYTTCFNGHYYANAAPKKLTIDFSLGDDYIILQPKFAQQNSTLSVEIQTKRALDNLDSCQYTLNNATQIGKFVNNSGLIYSSERFTLPEGKHMLEVSCQMRASEALPYSTIKRELEFYVDRTLPVIYDVLVPGNITTTRLSATINATDNLSGIMHYEIYIGTQAYPGERFNSLINGSIVETDKPIFNGLNLTGGETYYWSVRAFDYAGNANTDYVVSSGTRYIAPRTTSSGLACSDGVLNGDETDVDCGGSCGVCAVGNQCLIGSDCSSKVCGLTKTCAAPSCTDGIKNGLETGVDCGGACDAKCPLGGGCVANADCNEGICSNNICADLTCQNGRKDGTETDVDCGGICGPCSTGKICQADRDCSGGLSCQSGRCATIQTTIITDTTSSSSSGLAWYWWLLIILLILLLGLGGFYAYTVYAEEEKRRNYRNIPPPSPVYIQQQAPAAPQRSLHDQLKEALQKKLENERKLGQAGHPVFSDANAKSSASAATQKDKSVLTEVVTVEESIEKGEATKGSSSRLNMDSDSDINIDSSKLDKLRRLANSDSAKPVNQSTTKSSSENSKESLSKLKDMKNANSSANKSATKQTSQTKSKQKRK